MADLIAYINNVLQNKRNSEIMNHFTMESTLKFMCESAQNLIKSQNAGFLFRVLGIGPIVKVFRSCVYSVTCMLYEKNSLKSERLWTDCKSIVALCRYQLTLKTYNIYLEHTKPKTTIDLDLILPSLEAGPNRGRPEYDPNYGYEPYWTEGGWVMEKDLYSKNNTLYMCGVRCPKVYTESVSAFLYFICFFECVIIDFV